MSEVAIVTDSTSYLPPGVAEKHGLYKLVWERGSRRLLGIHVVCRDAGDVVQGFGLAMRLGATVDDVAGMHHAFPTFAEGLKAAAEQAGASPARAASPA